MAALGLPCCLRTFSRCSKQGLLFNAVRVLLIAVAFLVVEHRLCNLSIWVQLLHSIWNLCSLAWDGIHVPCFGRILNHQTTREAPDIDFYGMMEKLGFLPTNRQFFFLSLNISFHYSLAFIIFYEKCAIYLILLSHVYTLWVFFSSLLNVPSYFILMYLMKFFILSSSSPISQGPVNYDKLYHPRACVHTW